MVLKVLVLLPPDGQLMSHHAGHEHLGIRTPGNRCPLFSGWLESFPVLNNTKDSKKSKDQKLNLFNHHCGADAQPTAVVATVVPVLVALASVDTSTRSIAHARLFTG